MVELSDFYLRRCKDGWEYILICDVIEHASGRSFSGVNIFWKISKYKITYFGCQKLSFGLLEPK